MIIKDNYHTPFEKHREEILGHKSFMRKALFRGLFFLILAIIVTYYGKFRPQKVKIITDHGLIGWIFKTDSSFSILVVFPNDADYGNLTATGERIFINPLPDPSILDSNFIRYNKKDLFLAGEIQPQHIENYCSEVDSSSNLFYWGREEWADRCPKAIRIAYQSSRITKDKSVQARIMIDSATGNTSVRLVHQAQLMLFAGRHRHESSPGSAMLQVYLNHAPDIRNSAGQLVLTPQIALRDNQVDSSLILTSSQQMLGFILKESGKLHIKKLWTEKAITESF